METSHDLFSFDCTVTLWPQIHSNLQHSTVTDVAYKWLGCTYNSTKLLADPPHFVNSAQLHAGSVQRKKSWTSCSQQWCEHWLELVSFLVQTFLPSYWYLSPSSDSRECLCQITGVQLVLFLAVNIKIETFSSLWAPCRALGTWQVCWRSRIAHLTECLEVEGFSCWSKPRRKYFDKSEEERFTEMVSKFLSNCLH